MRLLSFQLMPRAVGGGREYLGVVFCACSRLVHLLSFQLMPRAVGSGLGVWSNLPAVGWSPVVLSADTKSSWRWEGVLSIVPAVGWWPVVLSADAKNRWRWCGQLGFQ